VYNVIQSQVIQSADLKSPTDMHWPNYHAAYKSGASDAELAKMLVKESA